MKTDMFAVLWKPRALFRPVQICAAWMLVVSFATAGNLNAMGYASLTCKELWEHKDQIYFDNGYCLPDSLAAERGDKGHCKAEKLSDVSFPDTDLQNLMLIARNEERKKCPRASAAPMADPSNR